MYHFFLGLLTIFTVSIAQAQTEAYIGMSGGVAISTFSAHTENYEGLQKPFATTTYSSVAYGFILDVGSAEQKNFSVSLSVNRYNHSHITLRSTEDLHDFVRIKSGGKDTAVFFRLGYLASLYTYNVTDISPRLNYAIAQSPWRISLGADIGFVSSALYERSVKIISPENALFEIGSIHKVRIGDLPLQKKRTTIEEFVYSGDQRTAFLSNNDLPSFNTYRIGVVLGTSYTFQLDVLQLVPFVIYSLPLTPIRNEGDWQLGILHSGVELKVRVG